LTLFRDEHRLLLRSNYPSHEELSELLSSLGRLMEEQVVPTSLQVDSGASKIDAARRAVLENGICQIPYPKELGGLGLPFGAYTMAMELAGAADASVALSVAIHNTVAEGVFKFGNASQRQQLIPGIISGEHLASFSLTEPTSGSDARTMNTKATRAGSKFVLNGSKMFITNAGEAEVYFVFAATSKGPSSFIVRSTDPGVEFGADIPKLGMRGSRTSEVRFVDCEVPEDRLVGEEGSGFEYAKAMLNASRIVMGSLCVGIAQAAFGEAVAYSKQRRAFGSPLSDFQLTREKIADMKMGISAGRLLCLHASRLREMGLDYASESAQAKVFSTEMSGRVCDAAIQIFGGYGYTSDDVHRHWRDARLLTIGEGTSEVLRLLIAGRELARAL